MLVPPDMIITYHYLFSLFMCDPFARDWYTCNVALSIVSILYLFTCYCQFYFWRRKYANISVRTQKVTGQFCTYPKGHRALIWATGKVTWKYHPCPLWPYDLIIVLGEVLTVFGMTIRSYYCTGGSNTRSHMTIQYYDCTRSVIRRI